RGIYEKELNEPIVKLIGYYLGKEIKKHGDYAAIGYDARSHSPILFNYLVSGLARAGVTTLNAGLVPTPVNYFCNYQTFDIGKDEPITPSGSIMITGSHNPSEYNGFKITIDKKPFFGDDIYSLGKKIISLMPAEMLIPDINESISIDAKERYINYLSNEFDFLKGFDKKIAYDCGNGVAGVVIDQIFSNLGLDTKGLFCEPDGTFPNHHPDPTVEKNLVDIKKEFDHGADIAFAFDGDADRIAVLTPTNNIKGDILALLYSQDMDKPTVIGEVKCSQVMYDEINRRGGKGVMYKTGHSNLKVKLRELNADLAAEVSGHIFFNDRYFGYDDAPYAALRTLELIFHGMDLDAEIAKLPQVYSTEEIKVTTTESEKFILIDKVKELLQTPPADFPTIKEIIAVDGVRVIFENGWGLVRASNTTPVLVTRFESTKEEDAKLYEIKLNKLIETAKSSLKKD
ncbi:MAG: phosphomannomutase/phosphoglucomutase, partial [Thiovulaceae bacterium]|nr:phosphomannomutase/phosphoglucomutase [Sulfurimonadaceae bacterium]